MDAMAKHAVEQLVRYACKPMDSKELQENRELALQRRVLRTMELAVIVANRLQIVPVED